MVITGGSRGFGKALAKAFAAEGARVIIASDNQAELQKAATELGVDYCQADVTVPEQLAALAAYATDKHTRIDVWINNAGVQIAPSRVEDVEPAKLKSLFDVNFFGYFYGCQVVLPVMKRQKTGVIININSTAGLDGKPTLSAYVASKFAIKGLTLSLRQELKESSICVYGIFPGGMQTDIYKEQYPADFKEYMSVDYAIQKVMDNLHAAEPEPDLVIKLPMR